MPVLAVESAGYVIGPYWISAIHEQVKTRTLDASTYDHNVM